MVTSSSQQIIATSNESLDHTPQPGGIIGAKAPFVPPKLTFVTPKLTKQGSVENLTASLISTLSP